MSILKSSKNKTTSHKLKRALVFMGWRRNISGKEKWSAKEPKKVDISELT